MNLSLGLRNYLLMISNCWRIRQEPGADQVIALIPVGSQRQVMIMQCAFRAVLSL